MLVLHVDLVNVLATLVKLAQAQNFVVSDLDGAALSLELFFKPEVLLD